MFNEINKNHYGCEVNISKHEGDLKVIVMCNGEYYSSCFNNPISAMFYLHRSLLAVGDNRFNPLATLEFVEEMFDLIEMQLQKENVKC